MWGDSISWKRCGNAKQHAALERGCDSDTARDWLRYQRFPVDIALVVLMMVLNLPAVLARSSPIMDYLTSNFTEWLRYIPAKSPLLSLKMPA